MRKWWICGGLFILALALVGCGMTKQPEAEKLAVTFLYDGKLPALEALVEEKLPGVDLLVEQYPPGTLNSELERRLRSGRGPDLMMTNMPKGNVAEYAYDLSAESFSALYLSETTKALLVDGQTRFLPLPGRYFGFIINKTLVDELGANVPETRQELLDLLKLAKEKQLGLTEKGYPFALNNIGDLYLAGFIMGTYAPDFVTSVEGIHWLADMDAGTALFSGRMENSVDFAKTLVDSGYTNPEQIISSVSATTNMNSAYDPERQMPKGQGLVVYGDTDTYYQVQASDTYEFVMIPALPDTAEGHSLVSAMTNEYIAVNNAVAGDSDKLKACLSILDVLSTQEGQQAWMEDTNRPLSYLSSYEIDESKLPEGIKQAVLKGYVYTNQIPDNILICFGKEATAAAKGEKSVSEALAAVDAYILSGSDSTASEQSLAGRLDVDLLYENYDARRGETALGNLLADAVREVSGAEIALVNSGGIRSSLYKGDVYIEDLSAACPFGNLIIVAEIDGKTIKSALENGLSQLDKPGGRFLQVSGLKYSFRTNPEGTAGELLSVSLPDGQPLADDDVFTVAYNNYMAGAGGYVESGDGFTMLNVYDKDTPVNAKLIKESQTTFADALGAYFAKRTNETVSAKLEGRIIRVIEE